MATGWRGIVATYKGSWGYILVLSALQILAATAGRQFGTMVASVAQAAIVLEQEMMQNYQSG